MSNHAYYLGEFLRMDHPKMKSIPKIDDIVDHNELHKGPEYLCCKVRPERRPRLIESHQKNARFEITHLVHNTSLDNFLNIVNEGKIRPGKEKEIKGIGTYRMSWWGLSFNKQITRTYYTEMKTALEHGGIHKLSLLNSPPFCKPSRYGNFRITIPVGKLIENYESSIKGKSQQRILWTDVYRWEVMHTILIHPEELSEVFKDLPLMDKYLGGIENPDQAVIKQNRSTWIWCPQSTSNIHPDSKKKDMKFKAWDHLTFAFLIPEDCEGIQLVDEDLKELVLNISLHSVPETCNLSSDKRSVTKYTALKWLASEAPRQLHDEHMKQAVIQRLAKINDEHLAEKIYGNRGLEKAREDAKKALNRALQGLKVKDEEEDELVAAVKKLAIN